jgi:hypothetical protein
MPRFRTPRTILAASILLGASALPALAADPDLPRIDPPGHWRLMTQDPSTTTSKCVGDTSTPLCAVETIRACFVRVDDKLCQIGMGLDQPPGKVSYKVKGLYERYRIVSAKRVREKDLRISDTDPRYVDDPDYAPWAWKVGDLKIGIVGIECWEYVDKSWRGGCERGHLPPIIYVVRKTVDHWRVVDWGMTRDGF